MRDKNKRARAVGAAPARDVGLEKILYHMVVCARQLRHAITVGLDDASDLVDEGLIVLQTVDGRPVSPDDYNDGAKGDGWTVTVEAVLLLYLYEPGWLHEWQYARARRN